MRERRIRMKRKSTAFFMAWGNFLSIPCPKKIWDGSLKKEMLSMLPIIGLIAGLIEYALCYVMRILYSPTSVTAFVLAFFTFAISGFMHADGFMDCCDAILSRRELEERQRILKDSRVGAFAVISMIFMVFGTFAALTAIAERHMATMAISYLFSARTITIVIPMALILIPVMSRAAAGSSVLKHKPLTTSQYAEDHTGGEEQSKAPRVFLACTAIAIYIVVVIIAVALMYRISNQIALRSVLQVALAPLVTALATKLFAGIARRNLGGMSGDIAGFAICMGELIGLITLALALSLYY